MHESLPVFMSIMSPFLYILPPVQFYKWVTVQLWQSSGIQAGSHIGDMSLAKNWWNFSILLVGNWHIMHVQATFIQFITCHFYFMAGSINCPWPTLQNAATCTLMMTFWCSCLPAQKCVQNLKWKVCMMIKARDLSYLLKTWKRIRQVCTYFRGGVWKYIN